MEYAYVGIILYLCIENKKPMKRHILLLIALLIAATTTRSQVRFEDYFEDQTLRLDYTLSGNHSEQVISLAGMKQTPGWYGRRVNLSKLALEGNGQLFVTDTLGRDTLYCQSFSTLFQEWQTYEEATQLWRSFEHTMLIPMPKQDVDVTLRLTDTHRRERARLTHRVRTSDILVERLGSKGIEPWRYVRRGSFQGHCINVAIVAEGYTEEEMDTFLSDCQATIDALQAREPFKSELERFNFIAVCAPSEESGVSIPHKGLWLRTALGSHFDTFYTARYLTTLRIWQLHNMMAGIPYEHIIILANTDMYGGGGIYNNFVLSAAHNESANPVVVHEFGHSFGGLADEYFYDDAFETSYPDDTEPWEPNITTLVDFNSKWKDMLKRKTPIPTKPDGKDVYTKVGVYEGAGYQSKGVYRPVQECCMKVNQAPGFCPVCERAIRRIIRYHTEE